MNRNFASLLFVAAAAFCAGCDGGSGAMGEQGLAGVADPAVPPGPAGSAGTPGTGSPAGPSGSNGPTDFVAFARVGMDDPEYAVPLDLNDLDFVMSENLNEFDDKF
jgi:hypothetical protein